MKLFSTRPLLIVTLVLALGGLAAGAAAFAATRQPHCQAYTSGNLIRLHVIANSDSPEDQAIKYAVRDALIKETAAQFSSAAGVEQVKTIINQNRDRFEAIANSRLEQTGVDYRARVEFGTFSFPTRSYYNTVLPAGEYEALRVVLGQGEGKNWWCVLFPPLCFVDIASTGEPPAAREVMAGPVADGSGAVYPQQTTIEPRLRLLEVLQYSQQRIAQLWLASYF